MNIKSLSNSSLVSELKSKVAEERKLVNEILELLSEVSNRKLFLDLAYPSLFEFCVRELGYSTSSAFRRIEAMRLLKSLPEERQKEIKAKINDGALNLTSLTKAQSFFKTELKENNKNYTSNEKTEILEKLENLSKLDIEKELVKISPQFVSLKQEVVRQLTEDKASVTLTLHTQLLEKIQKLKNIKSHVNPSMTTAELIDILVDQELKRLEPKSNKTRSLPPAAVEKEKLKIQMGIPRSRYIPTFVKHNVWQRDNGRCSFVNKETGDVCQSKHLLQYDHIHEFAKRGLSSDPKNIRLLCGVHNRHRMS